MQIKSLFKLMQVVTLLTGAAVIITLLVTSPAKIGPVGVTIWFVGLLVALQGMLTLLIYTVNHKREFVVGQQELLRSSWRQGMLAGGILTIWLALSSLRELSLRDVVLLLILGVLIEFYWRKRRS